MITVETLNIYTESSHQDQHLYIETNNT